MAASTSHPLLTKSIHEDPKGSIQMVNCSNDGASSMHAIHKWCAYHKSEKHSDSDCTAQQDSAISTNQTSKKCPNGAVKGRQTNLANLNSSLKQIRRSFFVLLRTQKGFPSKARVLKTTPL